MRYRIIITDTKTEMFIKDVKTRTLKSAETIKAALQKKFSKEEFFTVEIHDLAIKDVQKEEAQDESK